MLNGQLLRLLFAHEQPAALRDTRGKWRVAADAACRKMRRYREQIYVSNTWFLSFMRLEVLQSVQYGLLAVNLNIFPTHLYRENQVHVSMRHSRRNVAQDSAVVLNGG